VRRQPERPCIANSAALSSLASTHKDRVTEIRTGHERCLLEFERGDCGPIGSPYQVVASHSPIIAHPVGRGKGITRRDRNSTLVSDIWSP